jgi:transposase
MDEVLSGVVVGRDPHKRSVTIEVMKSDEAVLGGGRFGTDPNGFAALRRYVSRFPDRVWAIEGCSGIGHHVVARLLAAGEGVIDVPWSPATPTLAMFQP